MIQYLKYTSLSSNIRCSKHANYDAPWTWQQFRIWCTSSTCLLWCVQASRSIRGWWNRPTVPDSIHEYNTNLWNLPSLFMYIMQTSILWKLKIEQTLSKFNVFRAQVYSQNCSVCGDDHIMLFCFHLPTISGSMWIQFRIQYIYLVYCMYSSNFLCCCRHADYDAGWPRW